MDSVTEVTEKELRDKIAHIVRYYPQVADISPADYCCQSHAMDDITEEFGRDAARAWASMDTAKWLLGE